MQSTQQLLQALEHEEVVTQLKAEHAKQLSKQRLEFEEQVTAMEAAAAARLKALREADEQRARYILWSRRTVVVFHSSVP